MKFRTLISSQLYFGLEPLLLRRGAERTLARVAALPPDRARLTAGMLREDFRVDPGSGDALVKALLAGSLLEADPDSDDNYRLTDRFREYAQARVLAPLNRADAKSLVDQACRTAAHINSDRPWNPLVIDMLGVSGGYMSRRDTITELRLWPVVKARAQVRHRRFGGPMSKAEGSSDIRAALRELSSFIVVHTVTDTTSIERPFSVPFRAYEEMIASSLATARLLSWSSSLRRQFTGR